MTRIAHFVKCTLVLAAFCGATPGLVFGQAKKIKPLPRRIPAPALDGAGTWYNTAGPLRLKQFRGKFVILDFWTYCCINCLQTLPELQKLERAYPNRVVVIGVHSPKFANERQDEHLRQAIVRYDVEHPVVNDARLTLWRKYRVGGWPSLRIIDPEGFVIGEHYGEASFEMLDRYLKSVIPRYRARRVLDESPLFFKLERDRLAKLPLRFPGKVLVDAASDRMFIADSGHHRIVIAKTDGALLDVVGTGVVGRRDGGYDEASFDHPQGMALHGNRLYVADTENHLIRQVDLSNRRVTTIAGTGKRSIAFVPRASPRPKGVHLASPWALAIQGKNLYIAMAGKHQIWSMTLSGSRIGPMAGNGIEDIVDGPLLPKSQLQKGFSSFAQPSGLASDDRWLYVADSEGSSIRAVPFRRGQNVVTLIGTAHVKGERLFTFGDRDGPNGTALLQHPLGVARRGDKLYVADTYNHKIKVLDLKDRRITTIAGARAGGTDEPARFNEPSGLSIAGDKLYVCDTNNHKIRVIDTQNGYRTKTLTIRGLKPPTPAKVELPFEIPGARRQSFGLAAVKRSAEGDVRFQVKLGLPPDWKLNAAAPMSFTVRHEGGDTVIDAKALGKRTLVRNPGTEFDVRLPIKEGRAGEGTAKISLSLTYYYCRAGQEAICRVGGVTWQGTVKVAADAATSHIELSHAIPTKR